MSTFDWTTIDLVALLAEPMTPEVEARIQAYNEERERERQAAAAFTAAPVCGRCRGTGHIPEFRHISGGDCFACDGTGRR